MGIVPSMKRTMKEPRFYIAWPKEKTGKPMIYDKPQHALAYASGGPILIAIGSAQALELSSRKRPEKGQAIEENKRMNEEVAANYERERFTRGALTRKNQGHRR